MDDRILKQANARRFFIKDCILAPATTRTKKGQARSNYDLNMWLCNCDLAKIPLVTFGRGSKPFSRAENAVPSVSWLRPPSPALSYLCSLQNMPCFVFWGRFSPCLLCLEFFLSLLPGTPESSVVPPECCRLCEPLLQARQLAPSSELAGASSVTALVTPSALCCGCSVSADRPRACLGQG